LKRALKVLGFRRSWSCRLSERRSERSSETREKPCDTRASRPAMAPVAGTMLAGRA
jgi:hypothetical protein